MYSYYQAFTPINKQDKSLLWKLSWDNRYIWGKNQAWTLSLLSVFHNQQPYHVHDIMIARISEHNLPFTRCVLESSMLDFFGDFNAQTLTYQGKTVYQDLMIATDWISMCCELDLMLPNTSNLYKTVCFKCTVTKELLKTRWLDDLFQWHDDILTIADFPNAAFDNIPLNLCTVGCMGVLISCLTYLYCVIIYSHLTHQAVLHFIP